MGYALIVLVSHKAQQHCQPLGRALLAVRVDEDRKPELENKRNRWQWVMHDHVDRGTEGYSILSRSQQATELARQADISRAKVAGSTALEMKCETESRKFAQGSGRGWPW